MRLARSVLVVFSLGLLWLGGTAIADERAQDIRPAEKPVVFPGKDWAKAGPESQGVDPARLEAAVDYLARAAEAVAR